jgi:hypothetical protein
MATAVKTQDLDIVVNVKVKTKELDKDEVTGVLGDAVRHETDLARVRRDEFLKDCQRFEDKYHFSSDEFLERFESGELGDDADFFSWYAVKRGFDVWERRYQILSGVAL